MQSKDLAAFRQTFLDADKVVIAVPVTNIEASRFAPPKQSYTGLSGLQC